MMLHLDTENQSLLKKITDNFESPALYIYPAIQTDCFGTHQYYNFELNEEHIIAKRNNVIISPAEGFPLVIYLDNTPPDDYPAQIDFGIIWDAQSPQLYIKNIVK